MNNYEKILKKVKKLGVQVKKTGIPVITATQKKMELRSYQIDILESMKALSKADCIFSISKKRPESSGPFSIKIDYNGKRLIPLK